MSKPVAMYVRNPLDRRILMYVQWQQTGVFKACATTYRHMAELFGCCERTVRRHMRELQRKGYLLRRGYVSGKRGRLVVWNVPPKCRVIQISFAERVRAMSAFLSGSSRAGRKVKDSGGLEAYIKNLLEIFPEDQKAFLLAAIRRWGAGSVLDTLDQVADRYHADRAMRVVWTILAGRC